VGKGVLAPVPAAKYKYWADTVPLFTKNAYPNGKQTSNQGVSPAKAMFYETKDGKKLAGKPTEFLTMIPMIYNADTLGIRPDLVAVPVSLGNRRQNLRLSPRSSRRSAA
jgi:putative spermidine/putrescine transport system substrate-binding protein